MPLVCEFVTSVCTCVAKAECVMWFRRNSQDFLCGDTMFHKREHENSSNFKKSELIGDDVCVC